MAGIYIHIPFCKQACHYCNFHFVTSLRHKSEMVDAIAAETELQKDYLGDEIIETIYFGGGTPSLLTKDELKSLLDKIRSTYTVDHLAEVTLEANPDDISDEKLKEWNETGINRLSIGVQSFFDEDLQWMNRAHTAQQAIDNLQLAQRHFNNITIDLIYGTPQMTDEKWKKNVDTALALNFPHLSCYALTVEPNTPLRKMIRLHKSRDVSLDKQARQFLLLIQWLEEAGYEHYEISNFAKPGNRSRHNSAYWQGKKYLGLGPAAHSYNGNERQWNLANNRKYIRSIEEGVVPFEREVLTSIQQLNEYIMISLRTMEGINMDTVLSLSSIRIQRKLLARSKRFSEKGLLVVQGDFLKLTKDGKLFADLITAGFFFSPY